MAGRRVTLHLDPIRSSANLLVMIEALVQDGEVPFGSYTEILSCIRRDYSYTDRTEPLSLAKLLGLLIDVDGGLALSSSACAIYEMRPGNREDVLHYLLYTAWSRSNNDALALSWTYRAFCDELWERGVQRLTQDEVKSLVANLLSAAAAEFPDAERKALSGKSVLGMRRWLEALDPPVMHGEEFRRREVCSRELLALAVGHVAREAGAQVGIDLLLTPERRAAICRICLLEPSVLDRRLDQTLPAFPHLIAPGTRTGPYGRFVRLIAEPTITSFTR